MRKKLLSILALLCLTVTSAWAATDSGNCGEMPDESSVKWSLTDDGVLTISGTGAIREYGWSNYPWNDYNY